jgi:hypothetical protein
MSTIATAIAGMPFGSSVRSASMARSASAQSWRPREQVTDVRDPGWTVSAGSGSYPSRPPEGIGRVGVAAASVGLAVAGDESPDIDVEG